MQIQDSAKAAFQRVLHRTKICLRCATRRKIPGGNPSRFSSPLRAALILFSLFLVVTMAIAQINRPRHPQAPPEARIVLEPPAQEPPTVDPAKGSILMQAVLWPLGWPEPQPSLPDLPAQVALPMKQRIPVVLDTPLSTVNSKQGQIVTFHTVYSLPLGDGLEVPAETEILGHLVEVKRPAHFGREGELRLAVDRIHLEPDGGTNLEAHLDSAEMKGQGRFTNDDSRSTDLHPVVIDSAGGALLGAVVGGATGAGIGAGTGAAVAVLIMKSPRGQDVYLEQGMRFAVILDQPAYLSGASVYAAWEEYKKNEGPAILEPDSQNKGLPRLKRRRPPRH
jgi:hypothetical protein